MKTQKTKKKLYHYCVECEAYVARKKNDPIMFLGEKRCKYPETHHWKRSYIEE